MRDNWHDPRDGKTIEVSVDDVFGDARHENDDGTFDEQLRVVYVDDEVVLLRSNEDHERGRGYKGKKYVTEKRTVFEKNVGVDRFKKVKESEKSPPRSDEIQYHIGIIKRLIDKYEQQPGNIAKHKVEGFRELLEMIEEFDAEEIDWTEVDTIGEKGAGNLKDKGYVTDADIRAASVDSLTDVPYVGEAGAENIKEYVDENV
jgi:hypothetical protein